MKIHDRLQQTPSKSLLFFRVFGPKKTQDLALRLGGCLRLGQALDRHGRWIHPAGGQESLPRGAGLQTDPWRITGVTG